MVIHYKKNKGHACYDSNNHIAGKNSSYEPRPKGPFASCGECSYAAHGFICYSKEGDCLRTYMVRLSQERKK